MADKDNEPYRISAQQLFDDTSKRKVIPCCLSSDIALNGGIPIGCVVVIGGKAKSGKSSYALQCAANAQNLYGSKIFFYNIEGRLTKLVLSQTKGIKLDKDSFEIIMPPPILDKDDNVVGNKRWSSEQWLQNIGETIINNKNAIIIVDSIANLSSEKEQSEELGHQDRGAGNKIHAQFCRKYGEYIIPNQITLFLLTQVIANTGNPYAPPLQMKLSNSFRHQADVILFCKSIEKWPEQNGRILGHNIKYIAESSALGAPYLEMSVPLFYGQGIDTTRDLIEHAINWEIIKKSTSWYVLPFNEDGKRIDIDSKDEKPIKLQGEDKIRNWLLIHPEQTKELDKEIRNKVFGE